MCDFFNKLVYTKSSSLSRELCSDIIQLFETDNNKYEGVTGNDNNNRIVDRSLKITTDLNIRENIEVNEKWGKIFDYLNKELIYNIKIYIDNFQCSLNNEYKLFSPCDLGIQTMLIQRYIKNVGYFKYHDDGLIHWKEKYKRVLVYIWYLNDVAEGGETELCATHCIKPETGKLLIFPAEWTFPHRGLQPKSSDKYIITGWIYSYKDEE